MRSRAERPHPVFLEPAATALTPGALPCRGPSGVNVSYINGTNDDYVIVGRSDVPFNVQKDGLYRNTSLIIRVEHFYGDQSKNEVAAMMNNISEGDSPDKQAIKHAYQLARLKRTAGGFSYYVDYCISKDLIIQEGGSVYLSQLDLVISLEAAEKAPHHPYSDSGLRDERVKNEDLVRDDGSFGCAIHVVDNTGTRGLMFVNMNNVVYDVKPSKDYKREDGIYIVKNAASNGGRQPRKPLIVRYDFTPEGMKASGLYESYADAKALGDIDAVRKRELIDREHETKVLQREVAELKMKNELESTLREEAIKERDSARKLREDERSEQQADRDNRQKLREHTIAMERMELKDSTDHRATVRKEMHEEKMMKDKELYEAKSVFRKDLSETLKMVIPTVAATVAIIKFARSFMKSK